MALRNQLESMWGAYIDSRDGGWTPNEIIELAGMAAGVVATAAFQFSGDDAEWDALIDDVEYFVQQYIVPWDIPGLGPIFEGLVDRQLVNFVRPLLDRIRLSE